MKCNICGYPRRIEYQEVDQETGKTITKSHVVQCLGHSYIYPQMCNQHPDYPRFKKYLDKKREENV